jgi:D-alanyl-D-alanine carboxypeptidase/D-alanyl-D-alanine-endopeptidase (penicillin-binding protein 4)
MKQLAPVIFSLFVFSSCKTMPPVVSPIPPQPFRIKTLREFRTNQILGESQARDEQSFPPSQLGYILIDPQTKEVLEKYQDQVSFIPASTTKIPTTFAALRILGPRHRFKTYLAYRGKIQNDTLIGDLYIKGTGDPVFYISHLTQFAESLRRMGIRKITGNLFYDESHFAPQATIEEGREPWASFNSGMSALSLDFNQFKVHWKSGSDPSVSYVYTIPEFSFLRLALGDHPNGSETSWNYRKNEENEEWFLSPDTSPTGQARLPLKNPALATASVLVSLCQIRGISFSSPQVSPRAGNLPQDAKVILVHESPPLIELVESTLEYSNNLMAELILMETARYRQFQKKSKGMKHPITLPQASKEIEAWIQKVILREKHSSFRMINGSGLTSQNRISPAQLAEILWSADQTRLNSRPYETLLNVTGKKGNLENRLRDPDLALRILGKTGSLYFTRSLAGYLYTSRGRKLIFATFATDWERRRKIDERKDAIPVSLPVTLIDQAKQWGQKAQRVQDELIQSWVRNY